MSKEIYNQFFREHGPGIHTDPVRFGKIASLCRGRVLDVGCGTGDLSDFFAGDYTGVDISDVAVGQAKQLRRPTAAFLVGDVVANRVNLSGKFDTIVMAEFLEHIADEGALWDNLKDWAAEGARLIISVPNGPRVPDENHLRQFTFPELRVRFSWFGKVRFYNWPGVDKRIIMTCDLGQESDNLLSLAMIVKNEAIGLEKAIFSMLDIADNIVISVDMASSDATLEIAKLYADTLKRHEWQNDFAAARNSVQDGIQTKWTFILDGHEYLKEVPALDKVLASDFDAFFVRVELENGFIFYSPRLIRSSTRWAQPVHNYPEFKNPSKFRGIVVKHDRAIFQSEESRLERDKQRREMIIGMLGSQLKQDKRNSRAAFYLAQYYFYAADFKKAIKYYRKYLRYAKNKEERWLVLYELGNAFNFCDKPKKAIKSFILANRELPKRWEIDKRIGATLMIQKKFDKALDYLVESFSVGPMVYIYNPEPRNNAQTWYLISQCFLALKNYKKLKIAAKQALRDNQRSGYKDLGKNEIKVLKTILSA